MHCYQLFLLYLKSKKFSLKVYLITLYHLFMMFNFMRTIILNVFKTMYLTHKSHVALFLALWDTRVYIYVLNSCNMPTNIKMSVNKTLGLGTTLSILYINLDHYYIRFGETRSKNDIIEYIGSLKNFLYSFRYDRKVGILNEVWNV